MKVEVTHTEGTIQHPIPARFLEYYREVEKAFHNAPVKEWCIYTEGALKAQFGGRTYFDGREV